MYEIYLVCIETPQGRCLKAKSAATVKGYQSIVDRAIKKYGFGTTIEVIMYDKNGKRTVVLKHYE